MEVENTNKNGATFPSVPTEKSNNSLEVQRPLTKIYFYQVDLLSVYREFQSSKIGDYYFNSRLDFQGSVSPKKWTATPKSESENPEIRNQKADFHKVGP